jgi:hypothetical protein
MFLQVICKSGVTRLLNLAMVQSISYMEYQTQIKIRLPDEKDKEVTIDYATCEQAKHTFKKITDCIEIINYDTLSLDHYTSDA